jgi:hypothetical protein
LEERQGFSAASLEPAEFLDDYYFYWALAVLPVLTAELFPQEVRASALAICNAAPLNLGFAVFPFLVPLVLGMVGWQSGSSFIIGP